MNLNECEREGRDAQRSGLARFANPHAYGASKGSDQYARAMAWCRGWDAQNLSDDNC